MREYNFFSMLCKKVELCQVHKFAERENVSYHLFFNSIKVSSFIGPYQGIHSSWNLKKISPRIQIFFLKTSKKWNELEFYSIKLEFNSTFQSKFQLEFNSKSDFRSKRVENELNLSWIEHEPSIASTLNESCNLWIPVNPWHWVPVTWNESLSTVSL